MLTVAYLSLITWLRLALLAYLCLAGLVYLMFLLGFAESPSLAGISAVLGSVSAVY